MNCTNDCCGAKPYFSSNENLFCTEEEGCGCKEQVEQYRQLIECLKDAAPNHSRMQEMIDRASGSLAFYVEANRQLDKQEWKDVLADVKKRIQSIWQATNPVIIKDRKGTGHSDDSRYYNTTWFLDPLIANVYEAVLANQILSAQNTQRNKDLKGLTSRLTQYKMLGEWNHDENPASVRSVGAEFHPKWYTCHFPQTKEER